MKSHLQLFVLFYLIDRLSDFDSCIFIDCSPQLIFSDGENQVIFWLTEHGVTLAAYNLQDFFAHG